MTDKLLTMEEAAESLSKGSRVVVVGRLQQADPLVHRRPDMSKGGHDRR